MSYQRYLTAAIAALAFAPGALRAQSHIDVVAATPCLYEYRTWYYSYGRSSTFLAPSEFSKEQCDAAARTNERLTEERAAADRAMGKETGPRDDNERATSCLLEYRVWYAQHNGESFDDALSSFAPFMVQGKKQCQAARLADAKIVASEAEERARSAAEGRRRSAAEERAAVVQRRKAAEVNAARTAQAAKPGVRIGMTEQEVINGSNWGLPLERHRTTTANGTREQWVYGGGNYLYFDNGRLTAIQN